MSVASKSVRDRISLRSSYYEKVRNFFTSRSYLEVDVPALIPYSSIDGYIDPFTTEEGLYLHTSPEYAMKQLLAKGSGDIFFLGHVFRKEEEGSKHRSEFTMIEWYKTHTTYEVFQREIIDLIQLFVGPMEVQSMTYYEAFQKYTGQQEVPEQDDERHYVWAFEIESHFPKDRITIITHFPPSDAANANIYTDASGIEFANRMEFYIGDIELANAFDELTSFKDQIKRLELENEKRLARGKESLQIDPALIQTLEIGLPKNTFGVAAGFDRLLMLSQNSLNLGDVL